MEGTMQSRMLLLIACVVFATPMVAADLFERVAAPLNANIDHPATFYRLNEAAFAQSRMMPNGAMVVVPLTLPNGTSLELELRRFTVIDERSELTAKTPNGDVAVPAPTSVLLRGSVRGVPSSNVVLAVYPHQVHGRIHINHGPTSSTYLMNAVSDSDPTAVLYDMRFVKRAEPWHCAVLDTASMRVPAPSKGERSQASYRTINLALEGDQPFFQDNNSNITTATNYAEAVIAHVSDLYERDVSAVVYIGTFVLWTTPDPYPGTTTDALLTQFRDYYRTNKAGVDRTVAMLFTGINNLGGVAYVNTLCNNQWGYSICGIQSTFTYPRTAYAWDTEVTAHELGHNVGSLHTHSCTWAPAIDSCWYAENGNCFTTRVARVGTIMSYCHLNGSIDLDFGPRVETLMMNYISSAACLGTTSDLIVTALGDTAVCVGSVVQIRGSYSGGTGPYTVSWFPTTGMSNPTSLTPTVTPAGTTSYVLTVSDNIGVERKDTVVVTVFPPITIQMPASITRCAGLPVSVQPQFTGGVAPLQYRWRDANGLDTTTTSPTLNFVPKGTTILSVTVADARGCTRRDSMQLTINPRPDVILSASQLRVCDGDTVRMTPAITGSMSPHTLFWFANGRRLSESSGALVDRPDVNTTYMVIVTNPLGCSDTATVDVRVRQVRAQVSPAAVALPKLAFCENTFVINPLIVNTGVDEVRITKIRASRLSVASTGLPIIIPPGQSRNVPLNVTIDSSVVVLDTVRFMDDTCQRTWEVVITGQRGDIMKTPTSPGPEFETALMCGNSADTLVSAISITNSTAVAAQIRTATTKKGFTVAIPSAAMTVGAQATRVVPISIVGAFPQGYTDDTLNVVVRSLGCDRTFTYPVVYGADGLRVTTVKDIDFGEVQYNGPSDHAIDYDVTPASDAIDEAYVMDLTVTGPFTTTMRKGMRLPVKQATTFTARFNTRERPEGEHVGAIEFRLDNCTDVTRIPLRATSTTVSVDDEQVSMPQVFSSGGRIIVEPSVFVRAMVYDLRGERVATVQFLDGGRTAIDGVAPGVYAVVLMRDDDVVHVATVIVSRN
jgi:hypothetical protein